LIKNQADVDFNLDILGAQMSLSVMLIVLLAATSCCIAINCNWRIYCVL